MTTKVEYLRNLQATTEHEDLRKALAASDDQQLDDLAVIFDEGARILAIDSIAGVRFFKFADARLAEAAEVLLNLFKEEVLIIIELRHREQELARQMIEELYKEMMGL